MTDGWVFLGGVIAGGVVGWLIASARGRAARAAQAGELQGKLAAAESTIAELRRTESERGAELAKLREALQTEQQARVAAQTQHEEAARSLAEQRKLLDDVQQKMREVFTAVSVDALRKNSEAFARQTEEKVRPLTDALKRYEQHLREIEKAREGAYAGLGQQIKAIASTHQQLSQETSNLVHALRTPQVKGRWGELQLRRTVEVAGMSPGCDYVEQFSVASEEGRLRPDLVVRLPGDRTIVIDAKVSTNAYLDALAATDAAERKGHLQRYARAIRQHVQQLSSKGYWNQFDHTPDFVIMFIPGEAFFSAALEHDRTLVEDAMRDRVIPASPTTLIAMLRTVAYSWQQQEMIENARVIGETARTLFERVITFGDHFGKAGENLRRAVEMYNKAVSSWEARIAPMGRRITDLGVSAKKEWTTIAPIEAMPRALPRPDEPPPEN